MKTRQTQRQPVRDPPWVAGLSSLFHSLVAGASCAGAAEIRFRTARLANPAAPPIFFTPGKPFTAERMTDGSIRLVKLVEKKVPTVQPIRTKEGFLLLPVKLNRHRQWLRTRHDQ